MIVLFKVIYVHLLIVLWLFRVIWNHFDNRLFKFLNTQQPLRLVR